MRSRFLLASTFVALSLSTVACGSDSSGAEFDEGATEGQGGPGGKGATVLEGTYELSSAYDLTASGLLPDVANDTLGALTSLKESPSRTMFTLVEAAKIPVASTLLSAIPSVLKDKLDGYVDELVFKQVYENAPAAKNIASILDDVATMTTHFEIVTTLDVPKGDEAGNSKGSHALKGVAFTLLQKRTLVEAPDLLRDNTSASGVDLSAVHILERSSEIEQGRLAIGDHKFGVPVGKYVLLGVNGALKIRFGKASLSEALHTVIDCAAVAKGVAAKCVGPVCVGHEADLREVCSKGLDQVASQVESKITAISIDILQFHDGQARMWDAPAKGGAMDGLVDRLEQGFWEATLSVAKTSKPVATPFEGRRVATIGKNAAK